MTVKELTEKLKGFPEDYIVAFEETWDYYEDFEICTVIKRKSHSFDYKEICLLGLDK